MCYHTLNGRGVRPCTARPTYGCDPPFRNEMLPNEALSDSSSPVWYTESAMPIFASLFNRSRRVEAGTLPKQDSSSTVARGVAHSKSSVSSDTWRMGRRDGTDLAAGLPASIRSTATTAHVGAPTTSTLSPTMPMTARGRARPA